MYKRGIWLAAAFFIMLPAAHAIETQDERIQLIELGDADCMTNGGKLIGIENKGSEKTMIVWVDRWYMGVQTADHTRQELKPGHEPTPLGCSVTRDGGDQHWTIYSVKPAPDPVQ